MAEGNCEEASLEELWQLSIYLIASFQKVQNSVLSGPPLISQREIFPEKLLLLFSLSARMQYSLFEDHPSQRDLNVTFL